MTGLHFSYEGIHKTASGMNIHTRFTQPRHHVSELDAINGTKSRPKLRPKSRPESGPSWDHVGTKSGPSRNQVIFQSPIQLHKISSSNYYIRFVTEQVSSANHREHRDIADEITNLQINHKPCDELSIQQMIDTIRYPMANELNTAFNPQHGHITGIIEVIYDN